MAKIFDPICGFIPIDTLEDQVMKTIPFQRLRGIHQIGSASFVYGSGTHTRAEHSIGVMHMSSRIYDRIVKQENLRSFFPNIDASIILYWRRVLRIASLLHDVGHLPFSHVAEIEVLGEEGGHEKWTRKIIESSFFAPLWKHERLEVDDIVKIALGPQCYEDSYTPWEMIVTQMLTGEFGGDRIDYLLRDSYCTGLSYGRIDHEQLINTVCLLPYYDKIVLGLEEDGLESCYALFLARYFMHKRLYQNTNVKAYSYHIKELVKRYMAEKKAVESVEKYVQTTDFELLSIAYQALFDPTSPYHDHAAAVFDQKEKIKVFVVKAEEQAVIQQRFSAEDPKLFFEKGFSLKGRLALSFPVLLKNDIVASANEVADVSIPQLERIWAYVPHQLAEEVSKVITDVAKDSKKNKE